MAGVNPLRELLQPVPKKARCENVGVVPEARGGNPNEISPAIALQAQRDRREVHPPLKEVKPPDVRFPVRSDSQYNHQDASDEYQPSRSADLWFCPGHGQMYRAATGNVPDGSFSACMMVKLDYTTRSLDTACFLWLEFRRWMHWRAA
jgi:hypothetical protein